MRTKVAYGLESAQLTRSMVSRLQAFHLKGLRRILGMLTTYMDARVYARAAEALRAGNRRAGQQEVRPIERYLSERAHRLLAHVVRAAPGCPMRRVTFAGPGVTPNF